MAIKFVGCKFEDNAVGISTTESAEISIQDTVFEGNAEAIRVRDDNLTRLLPLFEHGVPIDKLLLLIEHVKATKDAPLQEQEAKFKESGLDKWLSRSGNIASVISLILGFYS